ncbi:FHA domain-containing protein [Acidiferrimicrobium sp. IK]|uniref:FHA domain-containing protein n=1 Tax=Acidiferrimicrobium sp. IK TaxID=2871700 RepID=UPI0021CB045A|nr:FHA domain-containing protein [Acidiferrimicrobium sp. IK]MCU4185609.1 FHA domain-containing protein [Acidiferrimicrobium sp. IK]
MTSSTYEPGDWAALAGPDTWVMVAVAIDDPVVQRVWEVVRSGTDLSSLLEALGATDLRAMPGFAIAHVGPAGAGVSLLARGEVAILASGEVEVDGREVTTWAERSVRPIPQELVLDAVPGGASSLSLPLVEGVVQAGRLVLHLAVGLRPAVGRHPAVGQYATPDAATLRAFDDACGASDQHLPADPPVPAPVSNDDPPAPVLGDDRSASAVEDADPQDLPFAGEGVRRYQHLFGATVRRSVEDAAIRPATPEVLSTSPDTVSAPAATTPMEDEEAVSVPPPSSSPTAELPAPTLIDALPWAPLGDAPPPAPVPAPRPVDLSTLPPPTWPPPTLPSPTPPLPNSLLAGVSFPMEEMTVRRDAMPSLVPAREVPSVLATTCPAGHLNPPEAERCRTCVALIAEQEPVAVPRPPLGVLRLSTGDIVMLDRGVVMGRSPRSNAAIGGDGPHLVKLGAGSDISRNHARIDLDGWHVLVTDLASTNGTWLLRDGRDPERLRSNHPTAISPGTTVSLAEDVSFRYEAIQ